MMYRVVFVHMVLNATRAIRNARTSRASRRSYESAWQQYNFILLAFSLFTECLTSLSLFLLFPFGLFYTSLAVASLSLFHIPYSLPTLYAPRDQLLLFRPLDSSFWKEHGLLRLYRRSFRR